MQDMLRSDNSRKSLETIYAVFAHQNYCFTRTNDGVLP